MNEKRRQTVIRNYRRGWKKGVGKTCLLMCVGMGGLYSIFNFVEHGSRSDLLAYTVGNFVICALAGALLGSIMWIDTERQFLRLKVESMEKKLSESGSIHWDRWPDDVS